MLNILLTDWTSILIQELSQEVELSLCNVVVVVVYDDWIKKHGPGSFHELVEPVDGFHPNQVSTKIPHIVSLKLCNNKDNLPVSKLDQNVGKKQFFIVAQLL